MKDNYMGCFGVVMPIVVTVIVIALSIAITKSIVNSDLPLWLKFFLLRG
jgi:cobalamin synthase